LGNDPVVVDRPLPSEDHVEDREMPVFAPTIGPRGHKLTLGENGRCAEDI